MAARSLNFRRTLPGCSDACSTQRAFQRSAHVGRRAGRLQPSGRRAGRRQAHPGLCAGGDHQPWNSTVQSIATVRARESVALTAAVSDVVEQVNFDSGDEVKAGQLLLRLRGNSQQAALTAAQATFEETDQLYRRQLSLVGQQLVAKSTVDTQRALRDAAQARVQQMRAEITDREVRAPFSGVLGIRQISPGSLITSSTVIATLDDVARMYVDFQVPESQFGLVQLGNTVNGSAATYPGEQFEGVVAAIDSRIDETTRSVTVRADFPNGDRRLRPGMLLEVRLFQPARQAVVIPEIAVVQVGRESYVFRVKPDSSVERADVRLGERRDGRVEILEESRPVSASWWTAPASCVRA